MVMQTYGGRLVIQCPRCEGFTMTEENGSWSCRPCAGTVLVYQQRVINTRGRRHVRIEAHIVGREQVSASR